MEGTRQSAASRGASFHFLERRRQLARLEAEARRIGPIECTAPVGFGRAPSACSGPGACGEAGSPAPRSSMRNASTRRVMSRDCCSSILAVAAFSYTKAEFCWFTSSRWEMDLLICSIPLDCSMLAEAISTTIAAASLIDLRISLRAAPALLTRSTPVRT